MYTLLHTNKHILCHGNRLHMVGGGHGPKDCSTGDAARRVRSARALSEVDRTEHSRQPVERDRVAVDPQVLDASHEGRCDGKHLLH